MSLLELILTKKTSLLLRLSTKYLDTSSNPLISWLNNQLKNSDTCGLNEILRLEFKSDNLIKPKAIKYIAKKVLAYYE